MWRNETMKRVTVEDVIWTLPRARYLELSYGWAEQAMRRYSDTSSNDRAPVDTLDAVRRFLARETTIHAVTAAAGRLDQVATADRDAGAAYQAVRHLAAAVRERGQDSIVSAADVGLWAFWSGAVVDVWADALTMAWRDAPAEQIVIAAALARGWNGTVAELRAVSALLHGAPVPTPS